MDVRRFSLRIEHSAVWMRVRVDRPVLAEAVASAGTGVVAERGALEAESALTMKPNGAENWEGPTSRRRDNIGAPAMRTFVHINAHKSAGNNVEAFAAIVCNQLQIILAFFEKTIYIHLGFKEKN